MLVSAFVWLWPTILENSAPKIIRTYETRKWEQKKLLIRIHYFILLGQVLMSVASGHSM